MEEIDLEKFICSLMQFTTVSKEVKYLINCALKDQGLEYRNSKIEEISGNQGEIDFCKNNCKGYKDTGDKCYSDDCKAKNEKHGLSEFELAIHRRLNLLNGDLIEDLDEEAKGMANELMDIARKHIASEINFDSLVNHFKCDGVLHTNIPVCEVMKSCYRRGLQDMYLEIVNKKIKEE